MVIGYAIKMPLPASNNTKLKVAPAVRKYIIFHNKKNIPKQGGRILLGLVNGVVRPP